MNKSARKKNVFSVFLTVLVIGLYLIPNLASAVTVLITTNKPSYENSDVVQFDVGVDIEDGERIPIQNLTLRINDTFKTCTFEPDGTFLTDCSNLRIVSKDIFGSGFGYGQNYGYGYGYGYGFRTVNTSFGYGYGLGFGYGYGYGLEFPSELSYTIEWRIGNDMVPNGEYEANLEALAKSNTAEFIYRNQVTSFFDVFGDNFFGNINDVTTNIPGLRLEINNSNDTIRQFEGIQSVNFSNGNGESVVEFFWDFSDDDVALNLDDVVINQSFTNGSNKIIISGINLTDGLTKTVYLNQTNESLNSVCVYDHEIASVQAMSGDCSFANETKVECNGIAQNGFTCTDLGTKLKVEGLEHSGLYQISYTIPAPPSVSTTGGGGGGGGGTSAFLGGGGGPLFSWTCGEWSECSQDGLQIRTCTLTAGTGGFATKPDETRECTYTPAYTPAAEEEEQEEETTPALSPTPSEEEGEPTEPVSTGLGGITGAVIRGLTKPSTIAAIIVLIIVSLALYAGYSYLYKKK